MNRPDDAGCHILHVDMDAFFASVEILDDPSLRGRPVAVGGTSPRSVVAAASYEARRYGVRSAMPMGTALRLCPALVVRSGRMDRYAELSARAMRVLESFTPAIEQLSIDEAFLDVRGAERLFGSPGKIAHEIRARMTAATGLSCSVGVASAKSAAKIASEQAKPSGVLIVPAAETAAILAPLPVGVLWGVGPAAQKGLAARGITRVGDLAVLDRRLASRLLGGLAERTLAIARGQDHEPVRPRRAEKSVGNERTFPYDISGADAIGTILLELSEGVGSRLRAGSLAAHGIEIKVRWGSGETISRSHLLTSSTQSGQRLYEHVLALWRRLDADDARVRLLGVRADRLVSIAAEPVQAELTAGSGRPAVELAMDRARSRFGTGSIGPGSLVGINRKAHRSEPDATDHDGGSA